MLSWLAVGASAAVLATSVGGYALVNYYDDRVTRVPNLVLGAQRPPELPKDAQNVLIVGSDSRGDLAAGEGTQGTGDTFVTGGRSDTMILAHLYGDADKVQLVSFPRDSWVTIPEHTDPKTGETVPARDNRLNSAFTVGGPELLVKTIEQLTGVVVDSYVQVDFDGFQTIVNRLDGVEVCLTEAAKDKDSGIDLQAGRQTIKGDQALAFVRQRQGLPNGDIDRISRQQQFIGGIVRKVLSAGTLLNPVKLDGVIKAATDSLQIDEGTELRTLAVRFQAFSSDGVIFATAPVADLNATRRGASVVLLDEAALGALFDGIRRDVPPGTPTAAEPSSAPAPTLIVAPAAVRVRVYNGGGVSGLGRRAYDDLEQAGFTMVGQPSNRAGASPSTVVRHGTDRADSARTLAAAIPGATLEIDPGLGRTLEVVVGSGYSGTVPLPPIAKAPGSGPAPASAPPGEQPPVTTAAENPCGV